MPVYHTEVGSVAEYRQGGVEIIDDDPRNYAFSNIFEVAATSAPYARIAVALNEGNVLEAARCEGVSPYWTCAHDEFVLVMDGEVRIDFIDLAQDARAPGGSTGAHELDGAPSGKPMGHIIAKKGHMALLPENCAYRFSAEGVGALLFQTITGPATEYRWGRICQTESLGRVL